MLLELLLTIPSRLNINTIPLLYEPLTLSLKADYDSLILGLKTLEGWVDNYSQNFLNPMLNQEPLSTYLITALSDILHKYDQPKITSFLIKLIGKLGGKSKHYLEKSPLLPYKKEIEFTFILSLKWDNNDKLVNIPVDYMIEQCINTIEKYYSPITVEAKISDTPVIDVNTQNNFTIYTYKYNVLKFIELIFGCLCPKQDNLTSEIIMLGKKCHILLEDPLSNADNNVIRLFNIIFLLIGDKDINVFSMKLIKDWIRHLLLVYVSHLIDISSIPKINYQSHYIFYQIKNDKITTNPILNLFHKLPTIPQINVPQYVYFTYEDNSHINNLSILLFNTSLVENLNQEKPDVVDNILLLIDYIYDISQIISSGDNLLYLHYFEDLTSKLLSVYTTLWKKSWAVIRCIKKLMETLSYTYTLRYACHIYRYLFDVLNSTPSEAISHFKKLIIDTINLLLDIVIKDQMKSNIIAIDNKILSDIIKVSIYQLLRESKSTREIAQSVITEINTRVKIVWDGYVYVYTELLKLSLATMKSNWNQTSLYIKIALLNSLNFMWTHFQKTLIVKCLDNIIEILDDNIKDTLNLLPDLTLSESEVIKVNLTAVTPQVSLSSIHSPFETLLLIEHRIEVLSLSEKVINNERAKLSDFLKLCIPSLSSSNPEVVSKTKNLLQIVRKLLNENTPQMPKTLLSDTISPLLSKLVEPTITVPLLKALEHLLQLFSASFNPGIGDRLLQHLDHFVSIAGQHQTGMNGSNTNKDDPAIIASLINLFHLIPPNPTQNIKYVDRLFCTVCQLEKNNKNSYYRLLNSPYRIALVHCMNRYSQEAVNLFLNDTKLSNIASAPLFFAILDHPEATELRKEFVSIENTKKILDLLKNINYNRKNNDTHYNILRIIYVLAKNDGKWIRSSPNIISELIKLWQDPKLATTKFYPGPPLSKLILDTFLCYASIDTVESSITWLFEICRCFTHRSPMDNCNVINFFKNTVAKTYPIHKKEHILSYFFNKLLPNENLDVLKTVSLKYMINPIISYTLGNKKKEEEKFIISVKECLSSIIKKKYQSNFSENLRVELLKFCTIVLENIPNEVEPEQKALIKYGWDHLRSEDPETKNYAFVNVCRFFERFQTPTKVINQVYQAMLKNNQNEYRDVLWKAFTILMPILPYRLNDQEKNLCLMTTCKSLKEETNESNRLTICKLIITYPDFFYNAKLYIVEIFSGYLQPSLKNYPSDIKNIFVGMIKLILNYLDRTDKEKDIKSEQNVSDQLLDYLNNKKIDIKNRIYHRIINYIICTSFNNDRYVDKDIAINEELLQILKKVLKLLPNPDIEFLDINPNIIQALFSSTPANMQNAKEIENKKVSFANLSYLKILSILINNNDSIFFKKNYKKICSFYKSCLDSIKSPNYYNEIHNFNEILFKLLSIYPNEISDFINVLTDYINAQINAGMDQKIISEPYHSGSHPPNYDKGEMKINRYVPFYSLLLLKHIFIYCPSFIDRFVDNLLHITTNEIEKFVFSSTGPIISHKSGKIKYPFDDFIDQSVEIFEEYRCEVLTSLHIILDLVGKRLLYLPAQTRKEYLEILRSILIQNKLLQIVVTIVDLVYDWVYPDNTYTVNPQILYSFCSNERRPLYCDELFSLINSMRSITKLSLRLDFSNTSEKYLELIYYYCLQQTDLSKLLSPSVVPLTYSFSNIREKFLGLINNHCSKDPYERLKIIFNLQNADTLPNRNWIIFANTIMLDCLKKDSNINLPPNITFNPIIIPQNPIKPYQKSESNREKLTELLKEEDEFVKKCKSMNSTDFINVCECISSVDMIIADNLWNIIFPQIWNVLSPIQQQELPNSVVKFITKEFHYSSVNKFSVSYNNDNNNFRLPRYCEMCDEKISIYSPIISTIKQVPSSLQTFLNSLMNVNPLPLLNSDIINYVGKTLNCTYSVINLLEIYISLPIPNERYIKALYELFNYIHDFDLEVGLYHYYSENKSIKSALFLEMNNVYGKARDLYISLIKSSTNQKYNSLEYEILGNRWKNCSKLLRQWEGLKEYAKDQDDLALKLECEYKLEQWDSFIKDISQVEDGQNSYQSICDMYDIKVILYLTCATTFEKPKQLQTNLIYKTLDNFSKRWCSLPVVLNKSHQYMLSQYQLLSELLESHIYIGQFNATNNEDQDKRNKQTQQLKHLIRGIWKIRLPEIYDPIEIWDDLLIWRKKFVDLLTIIGHPYTQEVSYTPTIDTSWTVAKRITVARKHNLDAFALSYIETLSSIKQMDMHDLYSKLRDQLLIYYKYPNRLLSGLDIIASTYLVYFVKENKAAMCRLKGNFLNKCRERSLKTPMLQTTPSNPYSKEQIMKAYSTSVSHHPDYYKTWINWGELYEKTYSDSKDPHDSYEAITCYLHAIACNSSKTLLYLSRVLCLLTYDESGSLAKQAVKTMPHIQNWLWIRHINQLLSMLSYNNADVVYDLLQRIIRLHPQSIITSLRVYHYITNVYKQNVNPNVYIIILF